MECPYCRAELVYDDYYGIGNFAAQEKYGYGFKKLGYIYRCPNHEGFKTVEEVLEYIDGNEDDLEEYCYQHGITSWTEVACDSSMHYVSGSFYTDEHNNLHDGYPC